MFLIDVSGSMAPMVDALRKNIEAFVDSLSCGDANIAPPVRDWGERSLAIGTLRPLSQRERSGWRIILSFGTLRRSRRILPGSQRGVAATSRKSLLDALYRVASM